MQQKPETPHSLRVKKLLQNLAREAERSHYDFLLIAHPRPARPGDTIKAEMAYLFTNPNDMATLLNAIATQQERFAQMIEFMWYLKLMELRNAQGTAGSKIIPQ